MRRFVLVTQRSETKPRAWIGELVGVRGRFALVRYCTPETPDTLVEAAMVVKVPLEDIYECEKLTKK